MTEFLTLTPLTLSLIILGLFALAAAIALLLPELRDRLQYAEMMRWPVTAGTVIRAEAAEYLDNRRRTDGKSWWHVDIDYAYKVQGRDYRGRRISPEPLLFLSQGRAVKAAMAFAPGQAVVVHYNPNNPSAAVLKPVAGGTPRLLAGFVLLLTGIASLVLVSPLTPPPPLPPSVIPRADCVAWRGTYHHMADQRFVARFVRGGVDASIVSPYYLNVVTPNQRNYWFRFAVSNGYGGIHLIPVKSPYMAPDGEPPADIHTGEAGEALLAEYREQLRFYPLDHELHILDYPPQVQDNRGGTPAFLLIPELGNLLWYEPGILNGLPGTPREELPRGMFKLTSCQQKPLL